MKKSFYKRAREKGSGVKVYIMNKYAKGAQRKQQ